MSELLSRIDKNIDFLQRPPAEMVKRAQMANDREFDKVDEERLTFKN